MLVIPFPIDIYRIPNMEETVITSIAAAAGGSRRRLPKAGVERSSYVGIAYTISVKLSN